jgi:hypothetical protein
MADTTLCPVSFVTLSRVESESGPPPGLKEQVIPIQRPGVEDTAFILAGKKGIPTYFRGFAVFADMNEAETFEQTYNDMIGADKYAMAWGGAAIVTHKYVVMDVQIIRMQRCSVSSSGHGAFIESMWLLCAVNDA